MPYTESIGIKVAGDLSKLDPRFGVSVGMDLLWVVYNILIQILNGSPLKKFPEQNHIQGSVIDVVEKVIIRIIVMPKHMLLGNVYKSYRFRI